MSLKQVENALELFSKDKAARAVVLKGKWGTGKTHLWNQVVKKKKSSFERTKYCYVSLFGPSNLKDLKQAIFENTVSKETADQPNELSGLIENYNSIGDKIGRTSRRFLKFAADISAPITKGLTTTIEAIHFASIRNTLICIDDFERKSPSLGDKEILGLISHLIEMKNCSVLLILNSNTIQENSDYFKYHEKVFDYEIEFTPTIDESTQLIFNKDNTYDANIIKSIFRLNSTNIRLFKKIKYFSEILKPYLEQKPEPIVDQALRTLSLAVWSIYEGDEQTVDIEFIKKSSEWDYLSPQNTENPDEERENIRKRKFLDNYGFTSCDRFDLTLIDLIEKGYPDDESIKSVTQEMTDKIRHNEAIDTLRNAWRLFHDSFDKNDEEVFQAFEESLKTCLLKLNPDDLDGVCTLYKEIGKHEIAIKHVDDFMDHLRKLPTKLDERDIFRWPADEYLNNALHEYITEPNEQNSFEELISESALASSHNRNELLQISQHEPEDFYNFFKSAKSAHLQKIVNYCMSLGNTTTLGDKELQNIFNKIFCNAYSAILRIHGESEINKARTARHMKYQELYDSLTGKTEQTPQKTTFR
jgi:hypothetical protein